MGIPSFYRWLIMNYPRSVVQVQEDYEDSTKPNPSGYEFDNLYLDMNGIIHPCFHPENSPQPGSHEEVFEAMFMYLDRIFSVIRPRKLLYMAIDGVAPRAKMNQQRTRRFRTAKEAADEVSLLEKRRGYSAGEEKAKGLDSNVITPGTEFMELLSSALQYYVHLKINHDPGWQRIKVILSDASVPGEGEHKIMSYIRLQRNLPGFDPNTRHCLYGLDADLIMLGLSTHEVHFSVLREDVQPSTSYTGRKAPSQNLHDCISKQKFTFVNLWVLREYLAESLKIPDPTVEVDLERLIDDFVFMCVLVGNDFLPHVPSLEISEGAIDLLMQVYKKEFVKMGGYLTDSAEVILKRVEHFVQALAAHENSTFKRRKQEQMNWNSRSRYRTANQAIPKAGFVVDKVDLGEDGWKERYYSEKFEAQTDDDREKAQKDAVWKYVEGICWVMHYYYQGVCSWQWFYPYHYAPFASDFHGLDELNIHFSLGKPFKPFDQLMGVLPAASAQALPLSYRKLMTDPSSPILDFYPTEFELDMNGRKQEWKAVCKLPFIDESRLLTEIASVEHTLTEDEKRRNTLGLDKLFFHMSHSLAAKILDFAAINKDNPNLCQAKVELKIDPMLSHGMNGYICISDKPICPSEISSPLHGMEGIMKNNVLVVFYKLPDFHAHIPRPPEGVSMPKTSISKCDLPCPSTLRHEKKAVVGSTLIRCIPPNSVGGPCLEKLACQLITETYRLGSEAHEKVKGSFKDHGQVKESSEDLGKVNRRIKDFGKVNGSSVDPGKAKDSTKDNGKVKGSIKDHGQVKESSEDLGKVNRRIKDFGKVNGSSVDQGKAKDSTKDNGKVYPRVEDLGKILMASLQNKAHEKVNESTEVHGEVHESSNDHTKVNGSTKQNGQVKGSIKDQGKANESIEDLGKVNGSIEERGIVFESSKDQENANGSTNDHGKVKESSEDLGKVNRRITGFGKVKWSSVDQGKANDSTKDNEKVYPRVEDLGKILMACLQNKAHEKVNESTEEHGEANGSSVDHGEVHESSNDHTKVNGSTGQNGQVKGSIKYQGKANQSIKDLGKVDVSIEDHGIVFESSKDQEDANGSTNDHGNVGKKEPLPGKWKRKREKMKMRMLEIKQHESLENKDHEKVNRSIEDLGKVNGSIDHGKVNESTEEHEKANESSVVHGEVFESSKDQENANGSTNDHGKVEINERVLERIKRRRERKIRRKLEKKEKKDREKVNRSSEDQGEVFGSSKDHENANGSTNDNGKVGKNISRRKRKLIASLQSKDHEKVNGSSVDHGEIHESSTDHTKVDGSTEENGEVSYHKCKRMRKLIDDSLQNKDHDVVKGSSEDLGKVNGSIGDHGKVFGSSKDHENANGSTKDHGEVEKNERFPGKLGKWKRLSENRKRRKLESRQHESLENKDHEKVNTSSEDLEKVNGSIEDQGKVFGSSKDHENANGSTNDNGEVKKNEDVVAISMLIASLPSKDLEKVNESIKDFGKVDQRSVDHGEVHEISKGSSEDLGKVNGSIEDQGKVFGSSKDHENANSTNDNGEVKKNEDVAALSMLM